jgi:hypothetical protein
MSPTGRLIDGDPAGATNVPAAVVNTPAGSETFAGVSDAFLLRLQQ